MTTTEQEKDNAKGQARAQLESIKRMVDALQEANENDEETAELDGEELSADDIRERIQEDPLSVLVRSGWYVPGSIDHDPAEFEILLCTGGPACRIVGDLGKHCTPETARLQYQDWFTPWEDYPLSEDERVILTDYAQNFYFED